MKRIRPARPNSPTAGGGSPGQAAYAASAITTRRWRGATRISAWIVAAAANASVAFAVAPPAIADQSFDLFMFNCGRVPTATPQLCKDTWDMVRDNKCRSTVVEYLDRRGVGFGDDRQIFNYAIQIQRGEVPLNVC